MFAPLNSDHLGFVLLFIDRPPWHKHCCAFKSNELEASSCIELRHFGASPLNT